MTKLKFYLADTVIQLQLARNDRKALSAIYFDRIGYDPVEDDPTATAEDLFEILRDWCIEAIDNDDSLSIADQRAAIHTIRELLPE
jgi:hypothetical protein